MAKKILKDDLDANVEEMILHAPDHDQFYPEKIRKPSSEVRILMPYRVTTGDWKGVDDGIAAFEKARKKNPGIKLVVFGQNHPSIPDYVEVHENPSNDELRGIYNSCDIFLFPSKREGFGMPPMEAMACGLAVVVTDVGAVREFNLDDTSIICQPEDIQAMSDALVKLSLDNELREKISKKGLRQIQKYSWSAASKQLDEVFRRYVKD